MAYGWVPHLQRLANAVHSKFGVTGGSYPGHQPRQQQAADFMIKSTSQGDAIAAWVTANADVYGVDYVIWNRRIWRNYSKPGIPAHTWAHYFDGNSSNPNRAHTNHVHVSVNNSGGKGGNPTDASASFPGTPIGVGVGIASGAISQAAEIMELYGILKRAAEFVSDKNNWIRILLILLGCYLILAAVWRMAGLEVLSTVKAVAS